MVKINKINQNKKKLESVGHVNQILKQKKLRIIKIIHNYNETKS